MSANTDLGKVGLLPRGEYSDEASYEYLDIVEYEGSSYVALEDTRGVLPDAEHTVPAEGAVWQLQAKCGADGITPELTFSVETGEPDSEVQIKQSGTKEHPVIELTVPRGRDGANGQDGMPGRNGVDGKDGADGKDYVILGPVYETLDALRQAVTEPNEGDRYEVGTALPYDVYRCTGEEPPNDWVNEGKITSGESGGATADFTINGYALNDENPKVNLNAEDVHARPDNWTPTAQEIGARPDNWTPSAQDVSAVPNTRKVNGKLLNEDIDLSASDVHARPDTWTPSAADVGALPSDTKVPRINNGESSSIAFELSDGTLSITVL